MSAPSGYTALDFVGFTDKGTYSPSATYMRNDLVHYGGNIMRCLIDNTTNVTPVVGANWELWVGASANLVERVIAPLENNPADVAYGVGRQIIYDDWLWEVIAPIAVGDALVDYAVDPANANIKKSAPVETQLLEVKAEADATDNMIAPTETNTSSSSAAYAVGDQLILNNVLYTVTDAITIGDALVSGTGGNIEASDSLTDQLDSKANSSDLATVATSGSYADLSNKPTLGTAAAKNSTNAVTQSSIDLVESGAVYSEVDSVKQALTNVKKKDFNSRYFLFVGDSYGDESGEWANLVISYLELTHATKLCVGGASFRASDPAYNFLTQIQGYTGDKTLITDIVVCGGLNDSISDDPSTYTDTISGMTAFNTYVKANYPNANVSLGYIGNGSDRDAQSLIGSRVYAARNVCRRVYYKQAALLGWSILYNVEYTLCSYLSSLGSDGVHPSSSGSSALCISIAQAIKNGMCDAIYPESTLNPSAAIGSVSTGDIKYKMCNDKATISSRNFTILTNAGTVFASGAKTKIATLGNILLNKEVCFLGYARLYNVEVDGVATSTYLWIPVMITIDEQNLYITALTTDGATSHSYNYVTAGYLTLCDFDYVFDSMIAV